MDNLHGGNIQQLVGVLGALVVAQQNTLSSSALSGVGLRSEFVRHAGISRAPERLKKLEQNAPSY